MPYGPRLHRLGASIVVCTRAAFAGKFPPQIVAARETATADLVATGQAKRARKVGDRAPSFALPELDGKLVASRDLLARGPLVVMFAQTAPRGARRRAGTSSWW